MRSKILAGTTSYSVPIFVTNSAAGGGLGSLVFNTSGLVGEYRRAGASSWTSITLATATLGTFASGGWIADGSLTGAYEVGVPNLAVASGATWVAVRYYGAANMTPVLLYIELDAVNYQSATSFVASVPSVVGNVGGNVTGSTGSVVGNIGGNVTGSTGSVIGNVGGAVGAVVGNIGGNVTGTVSSVVGNVGGSVASILGVTFPSNFSTLSIDSNGNVKIQGAIKKNTALAGFQFYMALASDHVSPGTGKTISSTVSLNGSAFSSTSNSATEIGNGWYTIDLAATDVNGATVAFSFAASLCDTTIMTAVTQP